MQDGITALGYASLHGHRNVVDTLIAAKADVNLCLRVSRILLCFFFTWRVILILPLSLFVLDYINNNKYRSKTSFTAVQIYATLLCK